MARATGGSMAAVIGRAPDEVNALLSRHGLDALDIANYNSQSQVVLAGPVDALGRAREILQEQGVTMIPLTVSAPSIPAICKARWKNSAGTSGSSAIRHCIPP
ncbi:hypothetical protein ACKZDW_23525 [Ralstonia syzygii subsp. celebesensis]